MTHVSRRPAMKIAAAAAGVAIAVTGCGSGQTAATATTSASSEQTMNNECGGMSIDHGAAVTRSSDIVINAPLQRVWDVQTDVESWDQWQDAVLTIERLD